MMIVLGLEGIPVLRGSISVDQIILCGKVAIASHQLLMFREADTYYGADAQCRRRLERR